MMKQKIIVIALMGWCTVSAHAANVIAAAAEGAGAAAVQKGMEALTAPEKKKKKTPDLPSARKVPIKPIHMPFDPKLVVFPFDENYTYPIFCKTGVFTHFQLQLGEKVVGFYLSDTLQWTQKVSVTQQDLFVKPTINDLATAATLITTKRRYQLSLSTVDDDAPGGQWYQRVSWEGGDPFIEVELPSTNLVMPQSPGRDIQKDPLAVMPDLAPQTSRESPPVGPTSLSPDKTNFNYQIEGDADWKPTAVFDDGRYIWVKFPPKSDMPVPFLLDQAGNGEITEFLTGNGFHVVQRLAPHGLLLKLGDQEVRISNKSADCGGWFKPECKTAGGNIRRGK